MFSDNCAGQNKNRFLFATLGYACTTLSNLKITLTFLECGHTQNEGDSVHALIENRSKNKDLFTPDMWYNIIRTAKRSDKTPYIVTEVTQDIIYNFKNLVDNSKWFLNDKKEKIPWSRIKVVHCCSDEPGKLFYKSSYDSEFEVLNYFTDTEKELNLMKSYELQKAYTSPLKISKAKHKDLITLCKTLAIPKKYHDFFNTLTPSDVVTGQNEDNNSESEENEALTEEINDQLIKEKNIPKRTQQKKSKNLKETKKKLQKTKKKDLKKKPNATKITGKKTVNAKKVGIKKHCLKTKCK